MKIKYNETVLIISDLHLWDKSGSNDFTYSEFKKIKTAESDLINNIKRYNPTYLIINGDIMEARQHKRDVVIKTYRNLFKFFTEKGALCIEGNHDKSGYDEFIELQLHNGKTVYIMHGHQGDKMMDNFFSKAGIHVLGLIEKIMPPVNKCLMKLVAKVERRVNYEAKLLGLKYADKYDYVVFGHTHITSDSAPYFNTGMCQYGQFNAVFIDFNGPKLVK